MKNRKPQGIQMGVVSILLGVVLLIVNAVMLTMGKIFPVILAVTPPLILSGIMFLIMPGINPPPEIPEKKKAKYWWKNSPLINKTVWLFAIIVGLIAGIYLMVKFTNFV